LARLQQGSRANSSACGSADVLEALGVNIDLGPEVMPFFS
jgi:anthranilate phosphoribosyltransferase